MRRKRLSFAGASSLSSLTIAKNSLLKKALQCALSPARGWSRSSFAGGNRRSEWNRAAQGHELAFDKLEMHPRYYKGRRGNRDQSESKLQQRIAGEHGRSSAQGIRHWDHRRLAHGQRRPKQGW